MILKKNRIFCFYFSVFIRTKSTPSFVLALAFLLALALALFFLLALFFILALALALALAAFLLPILRW